MKAKAQNKEPKFEESLKRLESLVREMESGDLPLEDILKKYEEGNRLIRLCAAKLNEAEQRIEILMKEKDGSLGLKPFELDEQETEDKEVDSPSANDSKSVEKDELF